MFGFEPGNTVYTRINRVATSDGMVGYALDALKEGFFGEQASKLILVEYEALTRAPASTLEHLYAERDPLYREVASLVVDTGNQSLRSLANRSVSVRNRLQKAGTKQRDDSDRDAA